MINGGGLVGVKGLVERKMGGGVGGGGFSKPCEESIEG